MTEETSFSFAIKHTLKAEGLFSDHPADPGGKTMYGITEDVAREAGYTGDMKDLPKEVAITIYKRNYWDLLKLDEISSKYVAAEVFDTAVNMGPHWAAIILQMAVVILGEQIEVDGKIGRKTLGVTNSLLPRYEKHLYAALNGFQFQRYVTLFESNPANRRAFIRGWMRRLGQFPEMSWG